MLRNKISQFAKATTIAFSVAALSAFVLAPSKTANAGGTLRIGMTAADIPTSFGQPDNGFEGFRFMGLMLYDALINWDLTAVDGPSGLVPGLAESWAVDPNDSSKWIFKLRKEQSSMTAQNSTPTLWSSISINCLIKARRSTAHGRPRLSIFGSQPSRRGKR